MLDEEVAVPALATLRYRFQGREWSAATGLVHFRMRWYDPETGRWLSKDPIGLSGGLNLYAFCGNDVINRTDPCGLFTLSLGVSGSAGLILGAGFSVGAIISYSREKGFHLGGYGSIAAGSYIGAGASIGGTTTVSGASDICDVSGGSITSGASGYLVYGGGVDWSVPLDGNIKNSATSVTIGVGLPGFDVHSMATATWILKAF